MLALMCLPHPVTYYELRVTDCKLRVTYCQPQSCFEFGMWLLVSDASSVESGHPLRCDFASRKVRLTSNPVWRFMVAVPPYLREFRVDAISYEYFSENKLMEPFA